MSEAKLSIPLSDLDKLPLGAAWQEQSGQARAKVLLRHDTLLVFATCDSLQRLVEYYREELYRARSDTTHVAGTSTVEVVKRTGGLHKLIAIFIAGLAAGATLTYFSLKKRTS